LSGLRSIAGPFVAAAPKGVRVRTRLSASEADRAVLCAVGSHLGSLAGRDLGRRCGQGRLDARAAAESRRERKQELTGECTSRWAEAITRTSTDAWEAAERNLAAEARSLRARIGCIRRRLAAPAGERRGGRARGYASRKERWQKQQRLQRLQARLAEVTSRLDQGHMSIVRGGRRLAKARHSLAAAGLDETSWRQRWRAEGRERSGHRPSRGRRGRTWRRMVAGIPTGRFRDRLVQMTANAGLDVIVVDPAYTSRWGAQHWLAPLREISPATSGHHAAAVVIGRRGLGQRARRREGRDRTQPEDRERRAANSAAQTTPASPAGLSWPRIREPGDRKARGQPHLRHRTRPAERASPCHQGSEDRSRCPEVAMSYSLPR
jgi:hypothetical protein